MTIWLLCSFLSFNIIDKLIKRNSIKSSSIILLGVSTAYLFSIRIAGILILLQYLITILLFINIKQIQFYDFLKKYYISLFSFIFFILIFTYILHPVYWKNPLEVINAIKSMSYYYNDVCTRTLGTCIELNSCLLLTYLSGYQ